MKVTSQTASRTRPESISADNGGRRRSGPHLAVGALLVVTCTAGSVWLWSNAGERRAVLAIARPVTAGQVLTAGDLREVRIAADADVHLVDAAEADTLLGRALGTSLPAGSLLTPEAVSASLVPAADHAVTAVALDEGQVPPELAAGASVSLVAARDEHGPRQGVREWPATVLGVAAQDTTSTTVVSVQLHPDAATQVAALPAGAVSIVVLPAGGDR
ncbi:SAF domain-containing protein [Actinoalloteichus caeruleus]|uniref:SAF domain-containing protein n=1 Tax=Actinoalloteichus cyanogriseus TaxID=2893586 RepID=UPI003AAFF81E